MLMAHAKLLMRERLILAIICSLVIPLHAIRADNITTLDGKTYTNVKLLKRNPDSIVVLFEDGGATIPYSNLSPELQKKYGYDANAASVNQNQASNGASSSSSSTNQGQTANGVLDPKDLYKADSALSFPGGTDETRLQQALASAGYTLDHNVSTDSLDILYYTGCTFAGVVVASLDFQFEHNKLIRTEMTFRHMSAADHDHVTQRLISTYGAADIQSNTVNDWLTQQWALNDNRNILRNFLHDEDGTYFDIVAFIPNNN